MRDAAAFLLAAARYWLIVFPRVCAQMRRMRACARQIPDAGLRALALTALAERGNIEGAAAFAVFVRRDRRRSAADALVLYQAIYNHTDELSEQASTEPAGAARCLNEALVRALDAPGATQPDYYDCSVWPGDGGYLAGLVEDCRQALAALPGLKAVEPAARRAARRIVSFQCATVAGATDELKSWGRSEAPAGSTLRWSEAAAAAGSSLLVHAAIAAAASARISEQDMIEIQDAYRPWICAFHSLLDSLLDEAEDARQGQLSLVGCYATREEANARVAWLARRAMEAAHDLPGRRHRIVLVGMAAHYLSQLDREDPMRASLRDDVVRELGWLTRPALLVFRVRGQFRRDRPLASARRAGLTPGSSEPSMPKQPDAACDRA